jgi:predicted permease
MPLVKGRDFNDLDDPQAAPVVMVNEAAVRRFWSHDDPIGKSLWVGTLPASRVVGVIADVKNNTLATPAQPEVFLPYPQLASPTLYFTVRGGIEPHALASALRSQIMAVNRGQPITDVQTMVERLESASAPSRSMMLLISVFSATALILALVGIYGLIAYSVAQRNQELGIRMALGASAADIFKLVIENGLKLALAGIAVGLVASFALTHLMTSFLFETSATDPITFIGSAILFAAVAALASCLPVRRAMRVDPLVALRHE